MSRDPEQPTLYLGPYNRSTRVLVNNHPPTLTQPQQKQRKIYRNVNPFSLLMTDREESGPSPIGRMKNVASAATSIMRRGSPPTVSVHSPDNVEVDDDHDHDDVADEDDDQGDKYNDSDSLTTSGITSAASKDKEWRYSSGGKKMKSGFKKHILNPIKQVADTANPAKLMTRVDKRRSAGRKPPLSPTVNTDNGAPTNEEAEESLLRTIENRARHTKASGSDGFRPAVDGEVPPLSVDNLGIGLIGDAIPSSSPSTQENARAQWMKTMNLLRSQKHMSSADSNVGRHRRAHTLLAEAGSGGEEKKKDSGDDSDDGNDFGFFAKEEDDIDVYRTIFGESSGGRNESNHDDDKDKSSSMFFNKADDNSSPHPLDGGDDNKYPHERLPLLRGDEDQLEELGEQAKSMSASERQRMARIVAIKRRWNAAVGCIHPKEIGFAIIHWFTHSTMIPSLFLFVGAWILYYEAGNPSLDFLPGHATVSWWFNFVGRQMLVMEIARFCKYMVVDRLVMSTRFVARILGSWLTYFCIQSKGWPFVVACWGLLDMVLLHGDNDFQVHWLYWTGIGIYSSANSGSYILSSELYLRVLISMVIVGVLTTLKRTLLTLYFNRRKFETYKPRLEDILNEIIAISDVAGLSVDADLIADTIGIKKDDSLEDFKKAQAGAAVDLRKSRPTHIRWNSVKFSNGKGDMTGNENTNDLDDPSVDTSESSEIEPRPKVGSPYFGGSSFTSGNIAMKELLIKWDEPVNARDKVCP
jgi:hypothetical protein